MAKYIDKSAVVAEIKGYISNYKEIVAKTNRDDSTWVDSVSMIDAKIGVLQHLLAFLDTLEVKEPMSEDLEEAANDYAHDLVHDDVFETFIAGAQWQKEQMIDKACMKLKKLMYDNLMFQGRLHREEVIDNFIEDFKKAMEE